MVMEGSGSDQACDEVVLRNVPVNLSEETVIECLFKQTGERPCRVDRFRRTAGGKRKPLPMCRVWCASAAQKDDLLKNGIYLEGVWCSGQEPGTPSTSAAALGKLPRGDTTEDEILLRNIRETFKCMVWSPDLKWPVPDVGDRVYVVPQGSRARRGGFHATVLALPFTDDGEGASDDQQLCRDKERVVLGRSTGTSNANYIQIELPISCITPVFFGKHRVDNPCSGEGSSLPLLVCCAETEHYRRLAITEVEEVDVRDDIVLEIGSDLGITTNLLYESHSGRVVGVDLSESSVLRARESYPLIRFEQLDVLERGALLRFLKNFSGECPFQQVFIDINGSRELSSVLQVISVVKTVIDPKMVCVKSRTLFSALQAEI